MASTSATTAPSTRKNANAAPARRHAHARRASRVRAYAAYPGGLLAIVALPFALLLGPRSVASRR